MAVFRSLAVVIALAVLFFGCEKSTHINDSDDEHIHGSGRIVTEKRSSPQCSGINVTNYGEVYLTQDSEQSIRVEADNNIIDDVITQEQDGVLQVGLKQGSYSDITLKVFVSLNAVRKLSINGAGSIAASNQIKSDAVKCTIIGAGNIYLSGSGDYMECEINGAGKIDAKNFHSKKCDAVVNGAGSCYVFADEELYAQVNGVGSIFYYGNPTKVTSSISGLGQIVRK